MFNPKAIQIYICTYMHAKLYYRRSNNFRLYSAQIDEKLVAKFFVRHRIVVVVVEIQESTYHFGRARSAT